MQLDLVTRTEDPHDRCLLQLALTSQGQQVLQASLRARQRWLIALGATLTVTPTENFQLVADLEPPTHRLIIPDPNSPRDARFLTVLPGADSSTPMDVAALVPSSSGTPFAGVVVTDTAVLFPVSPTGPVITVTYSVPNTVTGQLITGLAPNGAYSVTLQSLGGNLPVTMGPGSGYLADRAGVLGLGVLAPLPQFRLYLPAFTRSARLSRLAKRPVAGCAPGRRGAGRAELEGRAPHPARHRSPLAQPATAAVANGVNERFAFPGHPRQPLVSVKLAGPGPRVNLSR